MKTLLFYCLLIFAAPALYSQADSSAMILKNIQKVPSFSIVSVPDSSEFTHAQLQKGKPLILLFFNPDCDHCQQATKELLAFKEELIEIQVLMVSALPYPLLRTFYIDYSLLLMPNVKLGQDDKYILGSLYRPTRYPSIFVYDSMGNLTKVFASKASVPALIESTK